MPCRNQTAGIPMLGCCGGRLPKAFGFGTDLGGYSSFHRDTVAPRGFFQGLRGRVTLNDGRQATRTTLWNAFRLTLPGGLICPQEITDVQVPPNNGLVAAFTPPIGGSQVLTEETATRVSATGSLGSATYELFGEVTIEVIHARIRQFLDQVDPTFEVPFATRYQHDVNCDGRISTPPTATFVLPSQGRILAGIAAACAPTYEAVVPGQSRAIFGGILGLTLTDAHIPFFLAQEAYIPLGPQTRYCRTFKEHQRCAFLRTDGVPVRCETLTANGEITLVLRAPELTAFDQGKVDEIWAPSLGPYSEDTPPACCELAP